MKSEVGFQYSDASFRHKELVEACGKIYKRFGDDLSRSIFRNRIMYSFTDAAEYMRNVILETEEGRKMYKTIRSYEKPYIYGAGRRGQRLCEMFPEIEWGVMQIKTVQEN